MKSPPSKTGYQQGSTLIEAVIAMGVLAVAIPLVFGALAESGKSGMASEAETRGSWIVPTCMQEIQASRDGRPQYFTTTTTGQVLPSGTDIWALGFSAEGKAIGKISKALYDKGTKEIDGTPIRYIAVMKAATPPAGSDTDTMLRTSVTIEYPSTSSSAKRQKLDFFTKIP